MLHQELVRVRSRKGLAVEHGEYVGTVSCVGAPVRDSIGAVAAVSVAAPYGAAVDRLGPIVLATARATSEALTNAETATVTTIGKAVGE